MVTESNNSNKLRAWVFDERDNIVIEDAEIITFLSDSPQSSNPTHIVLRYHQGIDDVLTGNRPITKLYPLEAVYFRRV